MVRQLHDAHLSLAVDSRDFEGLPFKELTIGWVETEAAAELLHRLVSSIHLVNPCPRR
jgi:hypothetical protein